MSKTISAGISPKIRVEAIDGDLSVVGWDGGDILIKGDDEDIRLEQSGNDVLLSCRGDLSLRVPKAASFEFNRIGGDASIRGVMGDIKFLEASGDLSIRRAGRTSLHFAPTHLRLRGAQTCRTARSRGCTTCRTARRTSRASLEGECRRRALELGFQFAE